MPGIRIFVSALILAILLPLSSVARADDDALSAIVDLVTAGQFREAQTRIDVALRQSGLSSDAHRALEFQHVRMERMHQDFSLTADQVKQRVREKIPDLTDAEFARWDAHDLFEHMDIDGERMYFVRSPSNLFPVYG